MYNKTVELKYGEPIENAIDQFVQEAVKEYDLNVWGEINADIREKQKIRYDIQVTEWRKPFENTRFYKVTIAKKIWIRNQNEPEEIGQLRVVTNPFTPKSLKKQK